jgi:hypothetical protein
MGTAGNGHAKTHEVEQRELSVELTEAELRERGDRMAEAELQIETLKGERRELNAAIKAQVDLRAKLAHTIDSGVEARDVRCKWIEDFDKNCWRLVRQDNGATVDTRAMTAADRQGQLGLEERVDVITADGVVMQLERVGGDHIERDADGKASRIYPHVPSAAELAAEQTTPKRGPRMRTRAKPANDNNVTVRFNGVDEAVDTLKTVAAELRAKRKRSAGKSRDVTAELKARSGKQRKAKSKTTSSRHANA